MSLSGKDAKLKINGTSGTWAELSITRESAIELTRELYETTHFGDEGTRRGAAGVLDTTLDVTVLTQASQPTALTDIRDSMLNETEISVEFSPDGNATGGPTDVFAFSSKCSSYAPTDASVGSEQTTSATLDNSDGTKVSISGTFT